MKNRRLLIFALLISSLCAACQPSQRILEDSKLNEPATSAETTPVDETRDDFEDRLKSVQTGRFQFIYAFRRRDGGVLASEDKKYLKQNAPRDTNQWVLTRDEKAAIAGSNYLFTPEILENLRKRFEISDYSTKRE
jgi:hypothetical protein